MKTPQIMETVNGQSRGWTGAVCPKCKGIGLISGPEGWDITCNGCGGTGEEYGPIPETPKT